MENPKVAKLLKDNPGYPKDKLDFFDLVEFIETTENDLSKDLQIILAKCIRHFSKGKKASPKAAKHNDPAWVSLAASKDKTRPPLTSCYAPHDNTLVSTDGYRLHLVTDQKDLKPETFYSVIKGKLVEKLENVEGLCFPDYTVVIPTLNNEDRRTVTLSDFDESVDNDGTPLVSIKNNNGEEVSLSKVYVLEAFGGRDSMEVYLREPLDPVVFTSNNRLAVVMPINPKTQSRKR